MQLEQLLFRRLLRTIATMPFYAVAKGRQVGIFSTWPECQAQVNGFTGARFKKFPTQTEAQQFITTNSTSGTGSCTGSVLTANKKPALNWNGKRSASTSSTFAADSKKAKKTILLKEIPTPVLKLVTYGGHKFLQDDDGFVHVYTDGSCEGNGTAKAVAGLGVYFDEGHALNTSRPVSGRATNNCGEIQAATSAIKTAREQGIQQLAINTDSKFLIDSATKWMPGWKQRDWTLASGGPVKNKTDFMALDRELSSSNMQVKWNHVDAHRGNLGNERADQLARKGSEMYRNQRR
ncbi:ribonuclease H1 isoform X2 [Anopheles funestus]|uniref:ribonuclease H1 isoform X2 n=1 Tax=Anopheles funestus TaxID=62324 RepID=UPI0020C619DC|nr:ribonuclease H1 isoform X2 [Anopheles funestus]